MTWTPTAIAVTVAVVVLGVALAYYVMRGMAVPSPTPCEARRADQFAVDYNVRPCAKSPCGLYGSVCDYNNPYCFPPPRDSLPLFCKPRRACGERPVLP